jgi:hypothetical protein
MKKLNSPDELKNKLLTIRLNAKEFEQLKDISAKKGFKQVSKYVLSQVMPEKK